MFLKKLFSRKTNITTNSMVVHTKDSKKTKRENLKKLFLP